jgi:hypothetical protein
MITAAFCVCSDICCSTHILGRAGGGHPYVFLARCARGVQFLRGRGVRRLYGRGHLHFHIEM